MQLHCGAGQGTNRLTQSWRTGIGRENFVDWTHAALDTQHRVPSRAKNSEAALRKQCKDLAGAVHRCTWNGSLVTRSCHSTASPELGRDSVVLLAHARARKKAGHGQNLRHRSND
jgi:hypothetical protein